MIPAIAKPFCSALGSLARGVAVSSALCLPMLPAAAGELSGRPYVIDGDTVAIDRVHVRLWGIDAPELATEAGQAARRFLVHWLGNRAIRCSPKARDRHGRTVAQCFAGGEDLAAVMVRAGHARDWAKFSRGYYRNLEGKSR